MRCAECGLYECCMRAPFGGCPNGEKAEGVEVITTTDTKTWEGVNRPGITVHPMAIMSAAKDLVDAVEKYTRQECLRSELINKKNKLKELL